MIPFPPWEIIMVVTKSLNKRLFLSPWAVNFYLFFAVNFNSGFTTKLQKEEQCFHFYVMGKGLHNTIR